MGEIAVEWNNVGYYINHGFFLKKNQIINDFDLKVDKGTSLGLIGPNGAGKTSAIKLGVGLVKPSKGWVKINGNLASETKSRTDIGYLTENQYIYPHLRLFEWLEMLGKLSGISGNKIKSEVDRVLSIVELEDKSIEKLKVLSKGQIQRAGLAQALLNNPSILFLDEPMSGLDPVWRYKFKQIFLNLKKNGTTIIFSSHIISDILSLSDKIAYIESGNLKWYGNVNEMKWNNKNYEAVFLSDSFAKSLKDSFEYIKLEQQPDNSWHLLLHKSNKENFFEIALRNQIELESFSPVYTELEGFFGENLF